VGPITTCATPDLLLQHLEKTLAIYEHQENTRVAIAKHMQHPDETLATYM
jgi:hypothetical protein